MKSKKLTALILVGMLLGILVGYLFRQHAGDDAAAIKSFVDGMSILTDIFLRLIKMIIAPLVISTLVVASPRWATPNRWAASAAKPWAGSSAPRWCR